MKVMCRDSIDSSGNGNDNNDAAEEVELFHFRTLKSYLSMFLTR